MRIYKIFAIAIFILLLVSCTDGSGGTSTESVEPPTSVPAATANVQTIATEQITVTAQITVTEQLTAASQTTATEQITAAVQTTATAQVLPTTEITPTYKYWEYTVGPDDTLISIAEKLGVPLSRLAEVNGMGTEDVPQAGQILRIPDQIVYIVKPGDTLSKISQMYGISVFRLMAQNGISGSHSVMVGQRLIIPTQ